MVLNIMKWMIVDARLKWDWTEKNQVHAVYKKYASIWEFSMLDACDWCNKLTSTLYVVCSAVSTLLSTLLLRINIGYSS